MLKFLFNRLSRFKYAFLTIALLVPVAAFADDIPPTDNGGVNGQSTGAQNVSPGYSGAGSGADGSPGASSTSSSDNAALTKLNGVCQEDLIDSSSSELKIFSVGVKCFENITAGLAETTIQRFSADLGRIVYVVLIMYVMFFGIKVSTGISAGGRLKGEAFMSAMKIAFVAFLVYGFNNGFNIGIGFGNFSADISSMSGLAIGNQPGLVQLYAMTVASYHSILTIVMPQNGFGDCSSAGSSSLSFGSQGTDAVWASMDCMFSEFIGWNQQNGYATGSGLGDKGGIALIFGYIFSKALPANGFFIGGMLFTTLLTLMLGFFRLAFVYILSMIALILLFSIGPLMIPLMLFKSTEDYFRGWYKLILGVIVQPIILFAFFSFIGGMLVDTIKKLEALFAQMKPTMETSQVTQTGSQQQMNSTYVMNSITGSVDQLDQNMLLNGVVVFVVAYLLTSFINFVGQMASELAGIPELDLQGYTPGFMGTS